MLNFMLYNPVKVYFGAGEVKQLNKECAEYKRILLVYGGGSIKHNGVYDQVLAQLTGKEVFEFSGIEPNPEYETLLKAVKVVKEQNIDIILAVGGGSVIDGVKFIAAAACYHNDDYYEILQTRGAKITKAIPFGVVQTLPATGSEMNSGSVISRAELSSKSAFGSEHTFPVFAVLDPEYTYSLPKRQLINGVIDPFIHVTEQFLTTNLNTPIQDGFSITVLKTLISVADQLINKESKDYVLRSNWMWAATNALNGYIGVGINHDWATHNIGHSLTANYGLDHAQSLAIIAPRLWEHQLENKLDKLAMFATQVWGCDPNMDRRGLAYLAIEKTEKFFRSVGAKTRLSEYDIKVDPSQVANTVFAYPLGEHANITRDDAIRIITLSI